MDLDLSGMVALVTGSTKGIGHATALGLARMGASVIVNGRTEAAVAEAIDKIRGAVPAAKMQAAACDLATAEGCQSLIQRFPVVDILVNNLGIYEPKPFFDTPDEDWQRMFEVNVMSGVRLTRHYLKRMLDDKPWGRVVFISSGPRSSCRRRWCTTGSRSRHHSSPAAPGWTKGTNITVNSGARADLGGVGAGAARGPQGAGATAGTSRREPSPSATLIAAAALRHAGGWPTSSTTCAQSVERDQRAPCAPTADRDEPF
jgi:hypothetical protein